MMRNDERCASAGGTGLIEEIACPRRSGSVVGLGHRRYRSEEGGRCETFGLD